MLSVFTRIFLKPRFVKASVSGSRGSLLCTVAIFTSLSAAPVSAQTTDQSDATTLKSFKECAVEKKDSKRLACYDAVARGFDFVKAERTLEEAKVAVKKIQALEEKAAVLKQEKVALQKAEVERVAQEEQRKITEFGLPTDAGRKLKTLKARVSKARKLKSGRYIVHLENGHIWQQIEARVMPKIRPGSDVILKKAIMGNYKMTIPSMKRTIKVKRKLPQ